MTFIPLRDHPGNLDPSATLVSSARERVSIYRTRFGFVATDGLDVAIDGFFSTEADARDALIVAINPRAT